MSSSVKVRARTAAWRCTLSSATASWRAIAAPGARVAASTARKPSGRPGRTRGRTREAPGLVARGEAGRPAGGASRRGARRAPPPAAGGTRSTPRPRDGVVALGLVEGEAQRPHAEGRARARRGGARISPSSCADCSGTVSALTRSAWRASWKRRRESWRSALSLRARRGPGGGGPRRPRGTRRGGGADGAAEAGQRACQRWARSPPASSRAEYEKTYKPQIEMVNAMAEARPDKGGDPRVR